MTKRTDILAVVLCGGESSRMGRDKGLIDVDGTYWVESAVDKFRAFELETVVSVREQQYDNYKGIVGNTLIMDNDLLPVGGPLKGLLSVHQQYPDRSLFVLACDMPDISIDILSYLLAEWSGGVHTALTFLNGHEPEPLCGLYGSQAMGQIVEAVRVGKLNRFSMKHVLSFIEATELPMPEGWKACFANYNYPLER